MSERILVTGADGFIGSHLTEQLVAEGYQVKALSQYNSFNYWGWLEDVDCQRSIEVLTGDIRDPHYCKHITKDVDIIFHLAALIAIPYSYVAPDSYVDTNIKGTLNICQAALENGVKRVIHTSTSEVYGTAQYVPIDENHPLQPQSPYSASKIGADAMAMSFYNAFELPLTIARPFNTYGPRQSARAVIPTIITQIANGKSSFLSQVLLCLNEVILQVTKRLRPNTSKPHPGHKIYPYLLRNVKIDRVNQVWSTDITYIRLEKGYAYLCAIMDWYSRKIFSWRLSNSLDSAFCIDALQEAMSKYGAPEIFNTDQGCQFTSQGFIDTLKTQPSIRISMDGRGRALDNIFIERVWRSLKYENVYLKHYDTIKEARQGIAEYFDDYNEDRVHQSLDGKTPNEVYHNEVFDEVYHNEVFDMGIAS